MNSDTLRRLMVAARNNPDTPEGREAFAESLGVDAKTVRRWLAGGKISRASLRLLRSYRPRVQVARVAVEMFWQEEDVRELVVAPPSAPVPTANSKAVTETIAKDLADKLAPLKVDVEVLARLLAEKFTADAIALDVTGLLLPELRRVVDEAAQKFEATRADQSDTRELAKQLAECVALMLKLKQPDTSETANAVVDKAQPRLDALATLFKGALETLTGVVKRGLDVLGGKVERQPKQDVGGRAKLDELGNAVQGLHAKADNLGNGVQGLHAKANAHHRQTGRRFLALGGLMVAGFAAVIVTIVACTHAGPVPGAGLTRGGGVAEEAAKAGQQGSGWSWGDPIDSLGIDGGIGERKVGRPMPHSPLQGQAIAPCRGSADTLYGACWFRGDFKPPCPPDTFQEGQKCYVPIPAKPDVPVGEKPPGQETPTMDRPDAGMPGEEQ